MPSLELKGMILLVHQVLVLLAVELAEMQTDKLCLCEHLTQWYRPVSPPQQGPRNKTGRCMPSWWPSGFCSRPSLKLYMLSQGGLSKQQWLKQSSSFISRKWIFTQLWALRPFLYFFFNGKWQQLCFNYLECDVQKFHGAVFHRETCGLVSFLTSFCKHR